MSKGVICIDAGHGGTDNGAIGRDGPEKDYTLLQAHVAASILYVHNYSPIMTRLDDVFVELSERAAIANNAGAEAFISFHFNSAKVKEVSGTQVLYWKTSKQGSKLAEILMDRIAPLDGVSHEKWDHLIGVPRPDFRDNMRPTVLYKTSMPAVIVECQFGTGPDADLMMSPRYMVAVAKAVVGGLEEWKANE